MGKQVKDPLGILTTTSSDTLVEENGHDPLGILKKKDNTESNQQSSAPSIEDGLNASSKPVKQPTVPSEKAGISPLSEKVAEHVFDFFSSMGKTAYSTLKHTLPQAIDYLNTSENFNPAKTYEEKIAEDYEEEAAKNGISRADRKAVKEFALDKRKQLVGEQGIELEKKLHARDIAEKKIETKRVFEEHSKARAAELEGIPQSYKDVKDISGAEKYAGGLIGQAVASFPLILTGGASEGAEAYNEAIDEKAKKLSEITERVVTPKEVIGLGLDKDAKNYALGVQFVNGALDVVGFETILGSAFKKKLAKEGGKELVKKGIVSKLGELSKPALGEALTETAQELNTFVSSRKAAGRSNDEIKEELKTQYPRLIDAAMGGFLGGGVLGGGLQTRTVQQTIDDAKNNIKSSDDLSQIEKSAAEIVDKVKEKPTPEEGVQSASKIESAVALGEQPIGTQSLGGSGSTGVESGQQGAETAGARKVENESAPIPEQSKEEEIIYDHNTLQSISPKKPVATKFGENSEITKKLQNEIPDQTPVEFFAERKRSGTWDAKSGMVIDSKGQQWGVVGILNSKNGYIKPLNQQQNENDTGIRRTVQETGNQTKQGKGSEESSGSSRLDRTGEVRGEKNGEVVSSGQEKTQQINEESQNQSEAVQASPQESESANVGGEPPTTGNQSGEGTIQEPSKSKQFAVAKRILASDANPVIKQGIKEQGDSYVPKGLNITEQEAQDLIDHHGVDKSELMIKDPANGITPDTRVVMSGKLYEKYAKEGQNEKAVDTAIWAENFLMQAGRAANAGKFWKMITSSGEDQIVLAIERQQEHLKQSALSDIDRATTKNQLEAEFRRLVEEKVQSTVEERLAAAKLITKEKRKEIGDFFDKLKVDTKNNIATASILPIGVLPHVWNAAIDVIKQAVLTGADVANAIQAGIDHIKANQKEPFDEQKFRDEFTPEVQKIIPKKKIKASDIDPSKIQTPKILGKKKVDFINKVVEAFNKGELTDKKFDEIYASKLGFREFTSEDRAKIRKLAKTISDSEKYDEQLRALPADQFTRENIEKMKGLREAAKDANQQLQEYSQAPADVWDTLISIMQANLMSTMSLVSNVWYNVTYAPLRASSLGVATMVDYGLQKMARIGLIPKALDSRAIDFTAIQKGYFQGVWNGALEGLRQVVTGTQADERNLREIQSKFNPAKAVERWKDKDRTMAQKANDYIEGTIGWEAEGVFRLLNLGDKPFKRAAEWARANEIAAQKGLKGKVLEKFLLLPDSESEAEIVRAGKEATFQQDTSGGKIVQNALTQFLNFVRTVPLIGGPAKVIIKSQIPFVKTPLNLIIETIQYAAPPATLATGIYQISKGNKRSGSILVGKSIVGAMLWQASIQLFLKGLLTGDDDKDKKKRDFQSEGHTPPPNSINTSALSRGLAFSDWSIHPGDTWVSYTKMGVAGICLDNYSNIYKERIAKNGTITGGSESYLSDMLESAPRVASSTVEQSFLQGTSTALEALKSGDERTMNNWLVKTTESVGSILYPNIIATVAKASDEFSRDANDEELWQHLKNVYKAKMFMGDELPAKVSLWGDKIKGNPEGRSKYAYYLFDPSKFKSISTDDFRFRLYQAFKTDYSGDWLPSMPTRTVSANGQKVKLTPVEYEQLCISVGKERAALVSSYINSQLGTDKSNEDAKTELKMRYDLGYELGKEKFMINKGMNVKFNFHTPLDIKSMKRKLNKAKVKF